MLFEWAIINYIFIFSTDLFYWKRQIKSFINWILINKKARIVYFFLFDNFDLYHWNSCENILWFSENILRLENNLKKWVKAFRHFICNLFSDNLLVIFSIITLLIYSIFILSKRYPENVLKMFKERPLSDFKTSLEDLCCMTIKTFFFYLYFLFLYLYFTLTSIRFLEKTTLFTPKYQLRCTNFKRGGLHGFKTKLVGIFWNSN